MVLLISFIVISPNSSFYTAENKPKPTDSDGNALRTNHYSIHTEENYTSRIKRYLHFHNKKHTDETGAEEIHKTITSLNTDQQVPSSTRNQKLNAVFIFFNNAIKKIIKIVDGFGYGKHIKPSPIVYPKDEDVAIFTHKFKTVS